MIVLGNVVLVEQVLCLVDGDGTVSFSQDGVQFASSCRVMDGGSEDFVYVLGRRCSPFFRWEKDCAQLWLKLSCQMLLDRFVESRVCTLPFAAGGCIQNSEELLLDGLWNVGCFQRLSQHGFRIQPDLTQNIV
jgi:hypothetical protein